MRVVMTLLVRNEVDIIRENVEFHRCHGVDFFIVTDHLSEDGTADVLREYEKRGLLHYMREEGRLNQAAWVTRMARMAWCDYQADWVINNDADEFWCALAGDLRTTLSAVPPQYNVLRAKRYNFVPVRDERGPFYETMIYREVASVNPFGLHLPPKVCHRGDPNVSVGPGSHTVDGIDTVSVLEGPIEILHFPIRSYGQFKRRILEFGSALEQDPDAEVLAGIGKGRAKLYRLYKKGGLPNHYRRRSFSSSRIEKGLLNGSLIRDTRVLDHFLPSLHHVCGAGRHSEPLGPPPPRLARGSRTGVRKGLRPVAPLLPRGLVKLARECMGPPRDMPLFGPAVIGGLGGSGTRVVARLVMAMGFYLGNHLNPSYDNLVFTLLLRRPRWFLETARRDRRLVFQGLDILTRAMTGPFVPSPSEIRFIARAAIDSARARPGMAKGFIRSVHSVLKTVCSERVNFLDYVGWGWKEPNSHIYLDFLAEKFEDLRFILVIRHGLDMAYSRNKNQLYAWGPLFELRSPDSSESLPAVYLEYWIKANRRAIAIGERIGPERFHLLRFEELCSCPKPEITRLSAFLGLDVEKVDVDRLAKIPVTPDSVGRHQKRGRGIFSRSQLDAVRELGFPVEV